MTVKLSTGLRNAMAGTTGYSGALNGGVILVFSGPQPVSADAPATGTLLGIVTLNGGAWEAGDPANGLVLDTPAGGGVTKPPAAVWKFTGLAAGQIGWFRHVGNALDDGSASATLPRIDGAAGVGTGDAKFSTLTVAVGQPVSLDVYAFQIPAQ